MGRYDEEVDRRSRGRLDSGDNQRTRFSNDYVRHAYDRWDWWIGLLKVIGIIVPIIAGIAEIIHYWPGH